MRWLHFQTEMCHQRGREATRGCEAGRDIITSYFLRKIPLDKIALETWLDTGMVGMRVSKHCWM